MHNLDKRGMFRTIFSATLASLVFAANALAATVVQDVKGDVRAAVGAATPAAVAKSQNVANGTTLTTGPNSQVTLLFDDGQQVVLNENAQFRITEFQYRKDDPKADRSVFNLLRGAARFVTGALAQRSRGAWALSVPTATIGVRGTDFMVAYENPAYLNVLQGAIGVSNTAGTTTFGAGMFGMVPSATVLAVTITAAALPAAIASAFSSLSAAAVGAGAAGAGASGAGGGAGAGAGAAGAGVGTAAAVGAVAVAGVAAAASSTSSSSSSGSGNPYAGNWSGNWSVTLSGMDAGVSISGNCSGPWSATVNSSGAYTGTLTVTSCTSSKTGAFAPNYSVSFSGMIDANGTTTPASYSVAEGSGITLACSSVTNQSTTTNFNGSQTCTETGTITPCTGSCNVNITETVTITGTKQ